MIFLKRIKLYTFYSGCLLALLTIFFSLMFQIEKDNWLSGQFIIGDYFLYENINYSDLHTLKQVDGIIYSLTTGISYLPDSNFKYHNSYIGGVADYSIGPAAYLNLKQEYNNDYNSSKYYLPYSDIPKLENNQSIFQFETTNKLDYATYTIKHRSFIGLENPKVTTQFILCYLLDLLLYLILLNTLKAKSKQVMQSVKHLLPVDEHEHKLIINKINSLVLFTLTCAVLLSILIVLLIT